MCEKLWIHGTAQFILVTGLYILLLANKLAGQIFIATSLILFGVYYFVNKGKISNDEMLKTISGVASDFAFIIILLSFIILSMIWAYTPLLLNAKSVLLILFTLVIGSKILYQAYWYYKTTR